MLEGVTAEIFHAHSFPNSYASLDSYVPWHSIAHSKHLLQNRRMFTTVPSYYPCKLASERYIHPFPSSRP